MPARASSLAVAVLREPADTHGGLAPRRSPATLARSDSRPGVLDARALGVAQCNLRDAVIAAPRVTRAWFSNLGTGVARAHD